MAIRSNTASGRKAEASKSKAGCVSCMDCLHSRLMRYGHNPIVAECLEKPQPGNERFPYEREVAGALRTCGMHKHTAEVKEIEQMAA